MVVSQRLPKPGQEQSLALLRTTGEREEPKDGKLMCPNCKNRVAPRLVMYRGSPEASYCPVCGAQLRSFVKPPESELWPIIRNSIIAVILAFVAAAFVIPYLLDLYDKFHYG